MIFDCSWKFWFQFFCWHLFWLGRGVSVAEKTETILLCGSFFVIVPPSTFLAVLLFSYNLRNGASRFQVKIILRKSWKKKRVCIQDGCKDGCCENNCLSFASLPRPTSLSPFSCLPVSICVSKCAVLSNTNYTLNKQSLTKETPGVVVVAFSSLARIVGEGCTIHSTPVLLNFLKAEISSRTLITLFRPGSVHRGLASWDDCGRVFPDELHVSSFPDRFPDYAWTAV